MNYTTYKCLNSSEYQQLLLISFYLRYTSVISLIRLTKVQKIVSSVQFISRAFGEVLLEHGLFGFPDSLFLSKDFHGGPVVVVVEDTSEGTTKIWATDVDPHVLVVFRGGQLPAIVDVDGKTNSGVQSGTRVGGAKADARNKGDTNSPAAEVAFLGGSKLGVLNHQDDQDEEESASDLRGKSGERS